LILDFVSPEITNGVATKFDENSEDALKFESSVKIYCAFIGIPDQLPEFGTKYIVPVGFGTGAG
jgi:hypothetical protein